MEDHSNILVTGGAGMIGSNLVRRLVSQGHTVKVIDNLWRGSLENLRNEGDAFVIDIEKDFYKHDLRVVGSFEHLFDEIDYVFHLADVVAGIGFVFSHEQKIFRDNILINSNTINSVSNRQIKGFIYVGTACSYPESMQNSFTAQLLHEDDVYPAQPESAYGWSKLMGEYETSLLGEESNTPISILRLHNVYGSPCDYDPLTGQVIPSLIRKAINYPEEEFIVWGTGEQSRAFLHVDDVVDGLLLAVEKGLGQGVIQLGPDFSTPIRKIAEIVVQVSGKKIDPKFDASKPEGDKSRAADFSRARAILDWEPKIKLIEGIERVYRWIEHDLEERSREKFPTNNS